MRREPQDFKRRPKKGTQQQQPHGGAAASPSSAAAAVSPSPAARTKAAVVDATVGRKRLLSSLTALVGTRVDESRLRAVAAAAAQAEAMAEAEVERRLAARRKEAADRILARLTSPGSGLTGGPSAVSSTSTSSSYLCNNSGSRGSLNRRNGAGCSCPRPPSGRQAPLPKSITGSTLSPLPHPGDTSRSHTPRFQSSFHSGLTVSRAPLGVKQTLKPPLPPTCLARGPAALPEAAAAAAVVPAPTDPAARPGAAPECAGCGGSRDVTGCISKCLVLRTGVLLPQSSLESAVPKFNLWDSLEQPRVGGQGFQAPAPKGRTREVSPCKAAASGVEMAGNGNFDDMRVEPNGVSEGEREGEDEEGNERNMAGEDLGAEEGVDYSVEEDEESESLLGYDELGFPILRPGRANVMVLTERGDAVHAEVDTRMGDGPLDLSCFRRLLSFMYGSEASPMDGQEIREVDKAMLESHTCWPDEESDGEANGGNAGASSESEGDLRDPMLKEILTHELIKFLQENLASKQEDPLQELEHTGIGWSVRDEERILVPQAGDGRLDQAERQDSAALGLRKSKNLLIAPSPSPRVEPRNSLGGKSDAYSHMVRETPPGSTPLSISSHSRTIPLQSDGPMRMLWQSHGVCHQHQQQHHHQQQGYLRQITVNDGTGVIPGEGQHQLMKDLVARGLSRVRITGGSCSSSISLDEQSKGSVEELRHNVVRRQTPLPCSDSDMVENKAQVMDSMRPHGAALGRSRLGNPSKVLNPIWRLGETTQDMVVVSEESTSEEDREEDKRNAKVVRAVRKANNLSSDKKLQRYGSLPTGGNLSFKLMKVRGSLLWP